MWAVGVIHAVGRDLQVLQHLAFDECISDDAFAIFGTDITIPDILGVNHSNGAMLALVKAAGRVDTNRP